MAVKRAAAAVAGCAVVVTAGLAVNSGAQDTGPPTGTLTIFQSSEAKVHINDVAPKNTKRRFMFTPGDTLIVRPPLENQTGDRVGRAQTMIVTTTAGRDVEARFSATFMLRDGHIVVEGTDTRGTTTDSVAVLGGTGRYAGVKGTLEMRPHGRNRTRLRFTFID